MIIVIMIMMKMDIVIIINSISMGIILIMRMMLTNHSHLGPPWLHDGGRWQTLHRSDHRPVRVSYRFIILTPAL